MKAHKQEKDSTLYTQIQYTSDSDGPEEISNSKLNEQLQKQSLFLYIVLSCISILLTCIFIILLRMYLFTGTDPFRIKKPNSIPLSNKGGTRDFLTETNHINPWPDFCPYAVCNNSYACQPCQRRFVFLVAHGRSGSTSLLDALNMLPGLRISGENNGVIVVLDQMVQKLADPAMKMYKHVYEIPAEKIPRSWWHEWIPQGALACPAQKYVEILDPPKMENYNNDESTIIGFKTVRFHHDENDEPNSDREMLRRRVDAVRSMFPCSKFIFNIRTDLKAVSNSAWMGRQGYKGAKKVQGINKAWQELASYMGEDQATVMELEKWGKNADFLNEVVEWLGFKDCKFPQDGIPHDNDSKKGNWGYNVDDKHPSLGENCRYEPGQNAFGNIKLLG